MRKPGRIWSSLLLPLLVSCAAVEPAGPPSGPGGGGYLPPPPSPLPAPTAPASPGALLRFAPAQLAFGAVDSGNALERESQLANEGGAEVEILSLSVAGPEFRLTRDGCSGRRLAPGRSCPLRVRFAPVDSGPAVGSVTAQTADATRRKPELPLRGEGRRPRAVAGITLEPAAPDFGQVAVGAAAFLEVTVANTGGKGVRLRQADVIGPGFDIERDGCAGRVLGPQGACGISVRFVPVRVGRVTGALRIRTEDRANPLYTAALDGEGRERGVPEIRLGTRSVDFGTLALGEARNLELEVTSAGTRELRVRSVRAEGRGFAVQEDGCSGRALEPGRRCAIAVLFAPAAAGGAQGRLEISSDDPDEKVATVALAGKGKARRSCPAQQVQLTWEAGRDPEPLVLSGTLPRGECLTYELEVKRPGRLLVCVPPGYLLDAQDFELVEGAECRIGSDPVVYRRYVRRGIAAGTLLDFTLTRRDDARREFKALVGFREQREKSAPGSEAD